MNVGGQEVQVDTVSSSAERTKEELPTEEKSFTDKTSAAFDIGVRTPAALAYGMASWPFAQAARFGAVGGQKINQALGIVPKMTDEEITELGNQTAEWFSSLGGNLTPKTETGKSSMNIAGEVVKPIGQFAHWINSGIDREKYPHLGALADTTTEGMLFGFLHKFGTEAIDVGKRQLKTMEKNGQAKIRAEKKLQEKQAEVLAQAEEAAKNGELQEIIKSRQEKNQQVIAGTEGFSAIDIPKPIGAKPKTPTKSDLSQGSRGFESNETPRPDLGSEPVSGLETNENKLTTQRIGDARGLAGTFYGTEVKGRQVKTVQLPKTGQGVVSFEIANEGNHAGAPLADSIDGYGKTPIKLDNDLQKVYKSIQKEDPTYAADLVGSLQLKRNGVNVAHFIDPKTKVTTSVDLRNHSVNDIINTIKKEFPTVSTNEVKTKGIDLVENVPGQRSVYQILTAPLKNEKGFIEIPFSRKDLLEKTSPAFRENVRKFGELAEKSGKTMTEFLKTNDFSDKEIKQMVKVAEAVKLERPFKSPKSDTVISEGKNPLQLQPGEVNINTGPKANPKTVIGNKFFEGIRQAKELKLPKILEALTPTLHTIKDMKSPELLDLWHDTKAREGNRLKDNKILKDTTLGLRDQYPKRKLREEAFIKIMAQDKLGREALIMLDIKPIDGPIKYDGLVGELNGQFKDLFNQLNDMREAIGKPKIAERSSYLPMIAQENFYSQMKQLFKGQEGEISHPNMVLDSVQAISQRHSPQAVEATALRHLKRRGLRQGVKLETDPLKLLAQYGSTAYKHIHYSPFNMFVNQLTTGKFKVKNSLGKEFDWTMANQKPELHEFLSRWSNALAGKPNVMHGPALRFLESGAQKLSSNLTAAVLGWSARTILVQPTALLPTMTEFGVTPTVKGLMRTAMRSKKDPINHSQELPNRIADASMSRDITNQLKDPAMRALSLPAEKALSGMKFVDYVVAEATWRTAFESSKHLGESTAIRLADEAVVRTQGSGFIGDLSPIQMNALGKAVTLWQTFTINNMNWLGREVLNIKHPERNPAETARRVATYVIGTALINTLFEDELGIQSPQPAPIKAMILAAQKGDSNFAVAYQGLKEMTELAPFLSSLKFGSSPAGAVAEFLKELSNAAAEDLPRALNGDKKAIKRVGYVAAKLTGVPGTQQIKRFDQGTPLGFPVEKINSSGKSMRTQTERIKRTKTKRVRRQR